MSVVLPRMIDGNLLIDSGGRHAAVFHVQTVSWPYLFPKRPWWERLAYVAYEAETNFKVMCVNRLLDPAEYKRQALELLDDRYGTGGLYEALLDGQSQHLAGRNLFVPEVYVIVELPEPSASGFWQQTLRDLDRFRHGLEVTSGVACSRRYPGFMVDALRDRAGEAEGRLSDRLSTRPATTREMRWLFRRCATRGWREPVGDDHWRPEAMVVTGENGDVDYEVDQADLEPLLHEPVRIVDGMLEVDSEHGRCWQALCALGKTPREMTFPGDAELLYRVRESLDFAVDAVVDCQWMPSEDARTKIRRKVGQAKADLNDAEGSSHGVLSFTPSEKVQDALDAEHYTSSSEEPPWLRCQVLLAPAAHPDRKVVEARVAALDRKLGTIRLYQPPKQDTVYYDMAPRADRGHVRGFRFWRTIEEFAALSPLASHDLGTRQGVYFAHVVNGSRRPLLANLREAGVDARQGTWLLSGASGRGKTNTALYLLALAWLQGSKVIDFDYKGDHHPDQVPWLEGQVDEVDLDDPEKYAGWFDPLVILPENRRTDGATSYLMSLLHGMPPGWRRHVLAKVHETVREDAFPGCLNVMDRLCEKDAGKDANEVGEYLRVVSESSGLAKFGFSDGERHRLSLRKQFTVIRPSALQLPPAMKPESAYTSVEHLSVATFGMMVQYLLGLTRTDRTIHKVVHFDEAHHFFRGGTGWQTVDEINREARYWWITLFFSTQHVEDPGKIVDLVGTRVQFGTETAEEARPGLRMLTLDPANDVLAEKISGFYKGRCLVRDIHGQIAEAQVDHVFPEVTQALQTDPGKRAEAAAERVALAL